MPTNTDKATLLNTIGFNKYLVPECNKGDIHELLVVCRPLLFNNIRNQYESVDVTTDVRNGHQA